MSKISTSYFLLLKKCCKSSRFLSFRENLLWSATMEKFVELLLSIRLKCILLSIYIPRNMLDQNFIEKKERERKYIKENIFNRKHPFLNGIFFAFSATMLHNRHKIKKPYFIPSTVIIYFMFCCYIHFWPHSFFYHEGDLPLKSWHLYSHAY